MNASSSSSFVVKLDLSLSGKLRSDLIEQGFEITVPEYTLFCGKKKGVSCTLYQSGKLVVQGKAKAEFIEFYLEPQLLGTFQFTYEGQTGPGVGKAAATVDQTDRIGVDEAGKGDFYGPLCIAGVFAAGEDIPKLRELGARDSKGLADKKLIKIAEKIREHFPHHIVRINPTKYNEMYESFRNLNKLLAWGHAKVIEGLMTKTGCENVIIDQFAAEHVVETALKRQNLNPNLTQRHRGEEDLVVAAASILAREAFVKGIEKLGHEFGMTLPKGGGSQTIQAGREFLSLHGKEALRFVAKLHFKNLDAIVS